MKKRHIYVLAVIFISFFSYQFLHADEKQFDNSMSKTSKDIFANWFGLNGPDGKTDSGRQEMVGVGMRLWHQTGGFEWRIVLDPAIQAKWDEIIDGCYNKNITLVSRLRLIVDLDGDGFVGDQGDVDIYTEYVSFIVNRYNPGFTKKIDYFVLGNEVNRHHNWQAWSFRAAISAGIAWDIIRPKAELISISLCQKGAVQFEGFVIDFLDKTNNQYLSHIDFHDYNLDNENNYNHMADAYYDLKAVTDARGLDVEFIICETGTWSCTFEGAPFFVSEDKQAIDVVRRTVLPMSLEKMIGVCWSYGLKEHLFSGDECSRFSHTGLIFDGDCCSTEEGDCDCEGFESQKKVGYYTYERMTRLMSDSDFHYKDFKHRYHFGKEQVYNFVSFNNFDVVWCDDGVTPYSYFLDYNPRQAWEVNLITGQEIHHQNGGLGIPITVTSEPKIILY